LKYQSTGRLGYKYWVIEVYLTGNYMLNLVSKLALKPELEYFSPSLNKTVYLK
jgi:hypothetical protein